MGRRKCEARKDGKECKKMNYCAGHCFTRTRKRKKVICQGCLLSTMHLQGETVPWSSWEEENWDGIYQSIPFLFLVFHWPTCTRQSANSIAPPSYIIAFLGVCLGSQVPWPAMWHFYHACGSGGDTRHIGGVPAKIEKEGGLGAQERVWGLWPTGFPAKFPGTETLGMVWMLSERNTI